MDLSSLSRSELIKLAIKDDIRFKKSGNKAQIIAAIESGIKNSDPYWITCTISGITFDAVKTNTHFTSQTHPTIKYWQEKFNQENRYEDFKEAVSYARYQNYNIKGFDLVLSRIYEGKTVTGQEKTQQVAQTNRAPNLTQKEINLLLKKHGYHWEKEEILDIAQGETGEYQWILFKGDRYIGDGADGVRIALKEINSISS